MNNLSKEEKIEIALREMYHFRFNTISKKIELASINESNFKELDDRTLKNILRRLRIDHKIFTTDRKLELIIGSDFSKDYNPFIEYLEKLPEWDRETSYIQKLCDTLKAENQDFVNFSLPRWLIAVVGSMYDKKIINHTAPILAGKQNIGKSTWIEKLVPDDLKDYFYSGTLNLNSKDSLILMTNCMIIDLDELSNLNKNETANLKTLFTKSSISLRLPYNRFNENFARVASFIGSTNESEFLYDVTGTRRFLCYTLQGIDYKHEIDLNNVWAEAFFRYKNGEKHYFDKDETEKIEENNAPFKVISPLESKISEFFEVPLDELPENYVSDTLSIAELYKISTGKECQFSSDKQKTGKIMAKLGFNKQRNTINGVRENRYEVWISKDKLKGETTTYTQDSYLKKLIEK